MTSMEIILIFNIYFCRVSDDYLILCEVRSWARCFFLFSVRCQELHRFRANDYSGRLITKIILIFLCVCFVFSWISQVWLYNVNEKCFDPEEWYSNFVVDGKIGPCDYNLIASVLHWKWDLKLFNISSWVFCNPAVIFGCFLHNLNFCSAILMFDYCSERKFDNLCLNWLCFLNNWITFCTNVALTVWEQIIIIFIVE